MVPGLRLILLPSEVSPLSMAPWLSAPSDRVRRIPRTDYSIMVLSTDIVVWSRGVVLS